MLSTWIARWTGKHPRFPPLAPDAPFYVIGDIHGRLDLLQRLLGQLQPGIPVVCAGDYIDRGDDSAGVLWFLQAQPGIRCLMGNHEEMLLQFLSAPKMAGPLWLNNGGLQTLASFGVAGVTSASQGSALVAARNALAAAMGGTLAAWLRGLPCWHLSGNVFVTHAGADPARPVQDQDPDHLLWGHPGYARTARKDGIWVVHGHTVTGEPEAAEGHISVDTGAYATGRLTAALIEPGQVSFVST